MYVRESVLCFALISVSEYCMFYAWRYYLVFRRDVMFLFFTWLVLLCGLVNCSVDFSF